MHVINAQTKTSKPFRTAFLVVAFLFFIGFSLGIAVDSKVTILQISDNKDNLLYYIDVDEGDSFNYFSIHSVSGTSLQETIIIEDYCFITKKVRYEDQSGAGLPEYAYNKSEFYIEEGLFVIDNIDRINATLIFQVEKEYDNTIYINNEVIPLFSFFENGQGVVTFEILTKNRVELFLMDIIKTKTG